MLEEHSTKRDKEPLFTLQEANSLIPEFTRLFTEILTLRKEIITILESKSELAQGNGRAFESTKEVNDDLSKVAHLTTQIRDLVEVITDTGAEIKDLDKAVVDFRSIYMNRIVYLCWQYGEREIRYWHDLETGFANRKPLI